VRDLRGTLAGAVLAAWFVGVVLFLLAPIVTSIVYAFNLGTLGKQTALFTGWTGQWFADVWGNVSLRNAAFSSLAVAFWAALIAVPLGSALGFSMVRHPSTTTRAALTGVTYALLIVPETVIGVSLLQFYAASGIRLSFATLVAGVSPLAIAVTALIVRAGALTLDRRLEEAAADLGAGPMRRIWMIVLPHLTPAVLAATLMSYVFSFDNLVVSSFLTTARVNTLPVYLYGSLQYGPTPAVYAAAAAVFALTLLMAGCSSLLFRAVYAR
jgi:ABC-type spermidine/putrescine transport system permease subunit II